MHFVLQCKLSHVKGYHILVALGVCCSFTFILPSTTSPNALVYKRVKIPIKQMVSGQSVNVFVYAFMTWDCQAD